MDRFQEMQVFAIVAQEQGFSAAARRLGLSAASVTRAVAALEQRIGTQLLQMKINDLFQNNGAKAGFNWSGIVASVGSSFGGGGGNFGGADVGGVGASPYSTREPSFNGTKTGGDVYVSQTVNVNGNADEQVLRRELRASEARTKSSIIEARARDPQFAI